ncbi:TrbC/VirB2 family protein [Lysobacter sp. M2-1]|uniref:TrbC/VirB2 family protein n=1 Tax=Lysobacter sp. M2-1 TaxID=2916839 RepID=UPI002412939B|nr:TrbC/VirB2 family protein [Lysobacter sp. M2-1]
MKPAKFVPQASDARNTLSALFMAVVFVSTIAMPEIAMAQSEFQTKTCGFLSNITGLLNIASIAVVTIGIIFAGYQIAFAHKRISDVAPIMIGALLIGAAGQLANWIIGSREGSEGCGDISAIQQLLPYVA